MDNNKLLEEIKNIVKAEVEPINKRLDSLEQTMVKKTDLKSFVDTLNPAIKASEENIKLFVKAEIQGVKEDLQTEILASRAAAHEDMEKLGSKIWKKDREQDIRLNTLEEHTGLSNPIKH